ncbi:MAG: putative quinol monooxygenase [Litoreibacter sp.]|uniref:putative quinol monooxygenase n=1 Tax=Litoreibacter sp. TaxID=1969459 RepID=UPI00329A12DD
MFAVTVTVEINPAHIETFKSAIVQNAQTSLSHEDGCRQFDVCSDPNHPSVVFLYELYTDEAAFKVHMESPHYASFQETIEGMVIDKSVRVFSEVHQ